MTFFANVMLGRVRAYQGHPGPARACGETALRAATATGGFQEDVAYAMLAEAALAAATGPRPRRLVRRAGGTPCRNAQFSSDASTRWLRLYWLAVS